MSLRFLLNHSQEDLEDSGAAAARYLSGGSESPGPSNAKRPQTAESRSPEGSSPASPATLLGKRKVAAREDESGTESHSPGSEYAPWSGNPGVQLARELDVDSRRQQQQKGASSSARLPSLMPRGGDDALNAFHQPAGSSSNQRIVCYGMLHRVELKLLGDLTETSRHLESLSLPDNGMITLGLSEQPDHVLVSFADKTPLGYLRSHMKDALGPLIQHPDVEFDVVVEASHLQDTIIKARRTAGVVLDTDIYAYGPSLLGGRVGERLSQWKLWLQRPHAGRKGVAYENPHFLAVDKIVRRRER